jgi:hypothetical protein
MKALYKDTCTYIETSNNLSFSQKCTFQKKPWVIQAERSLISAINMFTVPLLSKRCCGIEKSVSYLVHRNTDILSLLLIEQ